MNRKRLTPIQVELVARFGIADEFTVNTVLELPPFLFSGKVN
jgi:hypothetical protein